MELSHLSLSLLFPMQCPAIIRPTNKGDKFVSVATADVIAVEITRRNGVKEWWQSARSSGILSSRSRTPLPKLMQSCQSFYAICNRIFPFDDEPVRCSLPP